MRLAHMLCTLAACWLLRPFASRGSVCSVPALLRRGGWDGDGGANYGSFSLQCAEWLSCHSLWPNV